MSLETTIQADLQDIDNFFKKEFVVVETNVLPLAIKVTEYAKQAIATGIPAAIADALSSETDGLSVTILNEGTILVNEALVVELDLQVGLANPTPENLGATTAAITTAITGMTPKAQSTLWTNFAVKVLNIFKTLLGQSTTATFAQDATAIENTYQAFLATVTASKAANNPGNVQLETAAAEKTE